MSEPRRRPRRGGFRLRVLGLASGILAVAIGVALVAQRALMIERLEYEVEATLEQERDELASLAGGVDPRTGDPFGGDVESIFRVFMERNVPVRDEMYLAIVDGRPFLSTQPAPVDLVERRGFVERVATIEQGRRGDLDTPQGPVRYIAVPLTGNDDRTSGVFVIAQLTARDRQRIDDLTRTAALLAAAIVAVTTLIAWLLAGRLLRPVRDLTETARRISETDLSGRIPVRGDDEIAELARTFNEMLDRLAVGFETQRAFVDDAGHELRTPITVIGGQLELMGDDPDERREVMAVVEAELARMSRIVEDLLVLAQAEQPDFVRAEVVEMSDFTTDVFVKAKALGARDWRLAANAEGDARVDPQRLTQAVLNLARNAVEHAPVHSTISIGSEVVGDELRLWVHDTGPSIPAEERERIFERFSRPGHRRGGEGAGLGLSIVRAIAEAHGGRAGLGDDERGGNRFEIVLPGVVEVGQGGVDAAAPDAGGHDTGAGDRSVEVTR